jgi:chromosome segregation ATPase
MPTAPENLASEMNTLAGMIKDLEDQLDRVVANNEALSKDLEAERKRRIELESTVGELKEQLRRNEHEVASKDNLRAELSHLDSERTRLMNLVRELNQKVEEANEGLRTQAGVIKRLRAARSDAIEEVQSVESQFDQAMRMVADAKAQIVVLREERNGLDARIKRTEDKLAQVLEERDGLIAEVDESRSALDEIRRSLADACVASNEALDNAAKAGVGVSA